MRYVDAGLGDLPELRHSSIEYLLEGFSLDDADSPKGPSSLSTPAFVFLVDATGNKACLSLIKSALLAAVEAICPRARVGLAVFSDEFGLYNLRRFGLIPFENVSMSQQCFTNSVVVRSRRCTTRRFLHVMNQAIPLFFGFASSFDDGFKIPFGGIFNKN